MVLNGEKKTTVAVDSTTKYSEASVPIAFSNLTVGETVKVRGTYNKSTQTVAALRVAVVTPAKKGDTPTPTRRDALQPVHELGCTPHTRTG